MVINKKLTHQSTKIHNRILTLKTIYEHQEISRADIARMTGLTRPTISSAVAELIDEGIVEETRQGPSAGGKPPIFLRVVPTSCYLIGIDLNSDEFRGGVLDLRGNLLHSVVHPVNEQDGDLALKLAYELIDELVTWADRPVLGIGLGTPGVIDAEHGIIRRAVNLDWEALPLQNLLQKRYDLPVYIANNTHLAALGEYTFGCHPDSKNLIVVKVGRGISAGIVIKGQLFYGDGAGAGEIGHVVAVDGGEACRCGNFGCLETVASTRAIVKRAKVIAQSNPHSLLHNFAPTVEAIDLPAVHQAFVAGDEDVQQIISDVGRFLGAALAHLVGALNIEHILIGGLMSSFGEPLLESIRRAMRRRAMSLLVDETQVGFSTLGTNSVILGAGAIILTEELGIV
ncbi:MAG TPA: ROK family transcriptional regulator [Anaerolineae bacterium]|nr:ROK family transcriptional regulator [Anaerolineales bacterium]HRV95659.1 ROK family transcriptional regulator [Anaerolineae bacterium]